MGARYEAPILGVGGGIIGFFGPKKQPTDKILLQKRRADAIPVADLALQLHFAEISLGNPKAPG
jgi:hypothetical protein